jgi:hypothetical protein
MKFHKKHLNSLKAEIHKSISLVSMPFFRKESRTEMEKINILAILKNKNPENAICNQMIYPLTFN